MSIRKARLLSTLVAVVLIFTVISADADYYVDRTNGNDNWTGTQPYPTPPANPTDGPWRSINEVNAHTLPSSPGKFMPGTTIKFKRGETWNNERLVISVSGLPSQPITFGAYDTGNAPVINAGRQETSWTETPPGSGIYFWNLSSAAILAMFEDFEAKPLAEDMTFSNGVFHIKEGEVGVYYKPTDGNFDTETIHRIVGAAAVTIQSEGGTTDSVNYVHLRDLHLTMGHRGVLVIPKGGAIGLEFHNLEISDSRHGIYSQVDSGQSHDNFVIDGVTISDSGQGIELLAKNSSVEHHVNALVSNNIIYNIGIDDSFKSWLNLDEEGIGTQNLLISKISNNEIYQVEGGGSIVLWINQNSSANNNNISNNHVHDVAGVGIVAGSSNFTMQDNVFHHNIIENCGYAGAGPHGGFRINKQSNNQVINNIIISCDVNLFLNDGSDGWEIKNNISIEPVNYHVQKRDSAVLNNHLLDHNLYYSTLGAQFSLQLVDYDFVGWKQQTEQDVNSKNSDPLFVNQASGDYHLTATSPAINTGTDVGLTEDLDGNTVVNNPTTGNFPEIGVYEYLDIDVDGIPDASDNCLNDPNPNQTDTDGDGIGNVCDPEFLTLVSDADQDGWVRESGENTSVGGGNKSGSAGAQSIRIGDHRNRRQYKSIVSFGTSALLASATVVNARLDLTNGSIIGDPSDLGALYLDLSQGGFNGNVALENADFQASATVHQTAQLFDNGDGTSSAILDSLGKDAIPGAAVIQLRLAYAIDDNNDGVRDTVGYYSSNNATTANHPRLEIEYTLAD